MKFGAERKLFYLSIACPDTVARKPQGPRVVNCRFTVLVRIPWSWSFPVSTRECGPPRGPRAPANLPYFAHGLAPESKDSDVRLTRKFAGYLSQPRRQGCCPRAPSKNCLVPSPSLAGRCMGLQIFIQQIAATIS